MGYSTLQAFYKCKVTLIVITLTFMQTHSKPVNQRQRIWDSHSPEPVARWCIKEAKSQGIYSEMPSTADSNLLYVCQQ